MLYFKSQRQPADPARHAGARDAGHRAADHQPLRPVAGGDDLLQPEAGRLARRRGGADPGDRRRATLPATISTAFQGAAKAFQSSLVNLWMLLDGRDPGGVHRARHSVRELHSPAHDSLGPAFGRLRRAADAVPLPHGSEHLRLRRPDHADRHREEERDHADRFRAGRGAQPGHGRRWRRSTRAA